METNTLHEIEESPCSGSSSDESNVLSDDSSSACSCEPEPKKKMGNQSKELKGQNPSKKQSNNRKVPNGPTMKNPETKYPQWMKNQKESSDCKRSGNNSGCNCGCKCPASDSSNKNSKTKNKMSEKKDQSNFCNNDEDSSSGESSEFLHCDCTTCQEVRFAQYQESKRQQQRAKNSDDDLEIRGKISSNKISKSKFIDPIIDRTVTKRLASANRDTINGLKGQINCLELKIKDLQKENATYKLMQCRQDKALTRYQGEFAELPTLIKKHKEELQGARQLLRKAENKCRDVEETIKIRDKRISKLQEENFKLSSFVNQYDMGNRYKLLKQLKDTKTKLRDTEAKAAESAHHLEVLHKSTQQRIQQDNFRMKVAADNLYKAHMRNIELRKYVDEQADRLKNFESLLVKNIRKNNPAMEMEDLRSDYLRNECLNRPKTYTLACEKNGLIMSQKIEDSLGQRQIVSLFNLSKKIDDSLGQRQIVSLFNMSTKSTE